MKSTLLTLVLTLLFTISGNSNVLAFSKTENSTSVLQQKKSKKKKSKSASTKKNECTYNGNSLNVGERGGCYYYSGSKKVYVDRSYCSRCR